MTHATAIIIEHEGPTSACYEDLKDVYNDEEAITWWKSEVNIKIIHNTKTLQKLKERRQEGAQMVNGIGRLLNDIHR